MAVAPQAHGRYCGYRYGRLGLHRPDGRFAC